MLCYLWFDSFSHLLPARVLARRGHVAWLARASTYAFAPRVPQNHDGITIESIETHLQDDRDRSPSYSTSAISVLDGHGVFRAPSLSPWGSEKWGAMFGSVGSRIRSGCITSITGSLRTAAVRTASTNASSLLPSSPDYFLRKPRSAKSPRCYGVAAAACWALGSVPSMSAPWAMDAKQPTSCRRSPLAQPSHFCTNKSFLLGA